MQTNPLHQSQSKDTLINLEGDDAVKDWAQYFNVTPEELKDAVNNAGSSTKDIQAWLDNKNRTIGNP